MTTRWMRGGVVLIMAIATVLMLSHCEGKMTAQALLDGMKASYTKVADFHEISSTEFENSLEDGHKSTYKTEIFYRKPNLIYYETNSEKVKGVAVCDGSDSFLYISSLKEYIKNRAPESISEFYKKTAGMGMINPAHVILETFLIDGIIPEGALKAASVDDRKEKVGSTICHVLHLDYPSGEKQTLWVGTKDYFIWKNRITVTQKALEKRLENTISVNENKKEDAGKESRIILVSTETMETVQADSGIDNSRFSFTVPPEAKEVSRFTSAGSAKEHVDLKGRNAPPFTLEDMKGRKVSLADFKGRVVILDFWDSWFKPCAADLRMMQKIAGGRKDLALLGLSEEKNAGQKERFIESNGLTFPMLYDEAGEVSKIFGVDTVPRIIIIDRKGKILSDLQGIQSEETIRGELRKAGIQ